MTGTGRIAVGVSGQGSNLRALAAAAGRGELGGGIVFVFADRPCPALDWATEAGFDSALIPHGDDAILAETLEAVAPDVVVLAGYMRIVGPAVLTTSLILLGQYGVWPTLFSVVANIVLCSIILFFSGSLSRLLGEAGSSTLSKISNLLLGAIGVMLMRRGLSEIVTNFLS